MLNVFDTNDLNSAIIMVNIFIVSFIRKTCIIGNFWYIILLEPEMITSLKKKPLRLEWKTMKKQISLYNLLLVSHLEPANSFAWLLI